MDASEFIAAIRLAVREPAIVGTLSSVARPPGRNIAASDRRRAEWLNSLGASEREDVEIIVSKAVDSALFGLLCVLDGVRSVEDRADKGSFELWFWGSADVLLDSPDGADLHDVYISMTNS